MAQFKSAPSTIFKGDETASIKIGTWPEPIYVRASDGGMFTLALALANGWQTKKITPNSQQPTDPGFWVNNGVPTFFDGQTNKVVDLVDGTNTSVFGTNVGDT